MTKRRMLLSIVFGSVLAITGCGDDGGGGNGTGGTNGTGATGGGGTGATGGSGTGGSNGGGLEGFCETLCESCAGNVVAQCTMECESSFGQVGTGIDFDSCPPELDALGQCLAANDCNSDACTAQIETYVGCIIGFPL